MVIATGSTVRDHDHTHDDRVLGSCGLVAVNAEDLVAQVVWAVDPSARGQGVRRARMACK
jgi:hypothetical protein